MSLFGGPARMDMMSFGQGQLFDSLQNLMNAELGQSANIYPGQITPGATANMQQAFRGAGQQLGAPSQQYTGALNQLLGGAGNPDEVMAAYRGQLGASRQEFGDVQRDLRNRYGSSYGRSGALPQMEAQAAGRYGASQDALLGNLMLRDTQNARQGQLGALGAYNQGQMTQASNLQSLLGIGQAERGIQGQHNLEAMNRFDAGQWYNNPALGFMPMALGTQRYAMVDEPSMFNQIVGGLGSLASMGSMFG